MPSGPERPDQPAPRRPAARGPRREREHRAVAHRAERSARSARRRRPPGRAPGATPLSRRMREGPAGGAHRLPRRRGDEHRAAQLAGHLQLAGEELLLPRASRPPGRRGRWRPRPAATGSSGSSASSASRPRAGMRAGGTAQRREGAQSGPPQRASRPCGRAPPSPGAGCARGGRRPGPGSGQSAPSTPKKRRSATSRGPERARPVAGGRRRTLGLTARGGRAAVPARLARALPPAGGRVDPDRLRVAERGRSSSCDAVPAGLERLPGGVLEGARLGHDHVRPPLVVNAGRRERLVEGHAVVDDVEDRPGHRRGDGAAARRPDGEEQLAVRPEDQRRRHRGERALPGRGQVRLPAHEPEDVAARRARRRSRPSRR